MTRRDWSKWPKRFVGEVNSASGIVGVVASVATAAAVAASETIVAAISILIAMGGLGWSAVRAVPKPLRKPEDLLGRRIYDFSELIEVNPTLHRIGFIGPTRVGKSTTVAHLQAEPAAGSRTDNPYATVIRLPAASQRYYALIDAAGHQYSQQFKVADNADDIVVFLDHSTSDSDASLSRPRLTEQKRFLSQLSDHLSNQSKRPHRILFLINKRDLWENGKDRQAIERWYGKVISDWPVHPQSIILTARHSNLITADRTALVQTLSKWI